MYIGTSKSVTAIEAGLLSDLPESGIRAPDGVPSEMAMLQNWLSVIAMLVNLS